MLNWASWLNELGMIIIVFSTCLDCRCSAFYSPFFRSVSGHVSGNGQVNSTFRGRPFRAKKSLRAKALVCVFPVLTHRAGRGAPGKPYESDRQKPYEKKPDRQKPSEFIGVRLSAFFLRFLVDERKFL